MFGWVGGALTGPSFRMQRTGRLPQIPVISIIDDDASVRAATNRLVRSLGYAVLSFASADEFLRSPQARDSSCVIADVQMPGMSGVELQSLMRSQGSRVPMIFITAFPDESIRARALNGGAVCFLTKPFDGPTLIKYLDAALERHNGGETGE
jgi:FixJ family two-component response regulator